jgi:hypothetical protein
VSSPIAAQVVSYRAGPSCECVFQYPGVRVHPPSSAYLHVALAEAVTGIEVYCPVPLQVIVSVDGFVAGIYEPVMVADCPDESEAGTPVNAVGGTSTHVMLTILSSPVLVNVAENKIGSPGPLASVQLFTRLMLAVSGAGASEAKTSTNIKLTRTQNALLSNFVFILAPPFLSK